ncbi:MULTISPECIES: sensor histidine kinase [Amycolatopsis]|uniref:histidine kinase n=1 Tax=Amycolatopsis dendrobii TaxID=2760662 RepID=A0A7W3VSS5_9PSEU|nr:MULTISPECIES: sensor histidine kinase [Amycolatopsis]MBB1152538.1 sensor histidine kinase [Amycolatopsis dendrobii]UKD59807.1 sensor histidine kinase [Amycolatopsis sp. FU40]
MRILRARPLCTDSLLAAAVGLFLFAGAAVHHGSLGDRPGLFGLLLAAAGAAPLVVRRRYPISALIAVTLLVGAFALAGYRATLGRPDLMIAAYTVWARYPIRQAWPPSLFAVAGFEITMLVGDNSNPVGDTVIAALQACVIILIGHSVYLRGLALDATAERADRAELAVVEERLRIARELHDVVSHHLSVISVQANLARYVFESAPDTARGALDTITGTTTEALDELRRLLSVLRPPHHEPGEYRPQPGLEELPSLVSRVREAGLTVRLRVTGTPRTLPSGQQLCAYRVAQEALTNVLKHAPDSFAALDVEYLSDALRLSVADSGGGPRADGNPAGHGLVGMRERARMYGGEIEIGPREPAGFEVVLTLPYSDRTGGEPK